MLKKILIGLAVLILIAIGYVAYQMMTTRSHSPADVASYESGDLSIRVEYCRPYKKERLIFGPEEEGALQPYGKYWRVGANEATKFEVNHKVSFGGESIDPGSYAIYAIPDAAMWTIALNTQADRWGVPPPKEENDVLRISVMPDNGAPEREQFQISFSEDSAGVSMDLHWDKTLLSIPIIPIH